MDHADAKSLKIAFEAVMYSLNVPTHLAAKMDDPKLRKMVGALASEVAAKIDYEILPYIDAQHPELKSNG